MQDWSDPAAAPGLRGTSCDGDGRVRTVQPAQESPQRRRTRSRAIHAATSSSALVGCTQSSGNATASPGVKLEDKSGVVKEYQDTVAHFPLELPAGYSFPAVPPKALQQGQSEVGVGEGPAYLYWLCAWKADYLKSFNSSDSAGLAKALDNLGQRTSTSFAMNRPGFRS